MKLNKLKTFSVLSNETNVTIDGRTMILKAARFLFGRIIMGQNRKSEIRELLGYSLGPMPDGFLRKTKKPASATCFQKNDQLANNLPMNSAIIMDGTSLVHN